MEQISIFEILKPRVILIKDNSWIDKKYGERNCEKGIPTSSLMDSAMRHLTKYIEGWNDEDHLVSAFWNIAMCMYMEEYKPEMLNLPWQKEKNEVSE